jgi:molecular chaperone GrpE
MKRERISKFKRKNLKQNEINYKKFEEMLKEHTNTIVETFQKKMLYDMHKEQQIDKLHSELQEYKMDLLAKTNRPFINGLIYIFDDLDKILDKVKDDLEFSEKTIKIVKNIQEDILILLEENGIVEYRDIDEKFNPARQQVVKKVSTPNKELVGMVVVSIRPGFELANVVIRKEKVAVYILQKGE